jgi:hypothetical protein
MTRFSDEAADHELMLKCETEKAYAVYDGREGDTTDVTWLPKSLVECERPAVGKICTFTVPNWLAEREGLC